MQYFSFLSLLRTLAVGVLAAFAISLVPNAATSAVISVDNKTRNRAQRAIREGDFALAEEILRGLLKKNAQDNEARLGLSFALLKQRRLQDAYDHAARVIHGRSSLRASSRAARLRDSFFR